MATVQRPDVGWWLNMAMIPVNCIGQQLQHEVLTKRKLSIFGHMGDDIQYVVFKAMTEHEQWMTADGVFLS